MATDLERLVVSLEANIKKYETEMKRASGIANQEVDKIEKRFQAGSKGVGTATANLAAQFQDIAVQLQGGTSPLTVALQQGTQITQVIGKQGAAGAVSLLATAFGSLFNPVSLATVGIIALGGAAIQYFTKASSDVKSLDDLLQEHAELIKGLKDSYGSAGEGLDKLVRQNSSVIESLIRTSIVALQEQYKKLGNDAVTAMSAIVAATDQLGNVTGQMDESTAQKFIRFKDAIDAFRDSARSGAPDVRAFRAAVSEIEKTDADPKVKKLAAELLELTKEADKVSDSLTASQRAISETGRIASGEVSRIKEFSDALADLAKLGLPKLDDRAKAFEGLQKALAGAGSNIGLIRSAETEYLASIDRITQREKEEADKQSAEEAKRLADRNARRAAANERSFQQDIENVRKSTAALQIEFDMIGKSAQERDKARTILQLESEARKHNIELTDEQRGKIENLADAYAQASERARTANEIMSEIRNVGSALSDAFKSAVIEGRNLNDVLSQLLNRLASRAIDSAFDGLFRSAGGSLLGGLFGGSGGGTGFATNPWSAAGMFGGMRASGGPVSAGSGYVVGEKGPEFFVPGQSGMIIPNDRLGGGGGVSVPVSIAIDARGADEAGLARVQTQLARLEASIPQRVVIAIRESRSANVKI